MDLCLSGFKIFADLLDASILDQYITDFIILCGWVNDPPPFEQDPIHVRFPPMSTNVKSAMRTATPFFTSS